MLSLAASVSICGTDQQSHFTQLAEWHAICAELAGSTISLKEIEKARSERHKQVRAGLGTRATLVNQFLEVHNTPPPASKTVRAEPAQVETRPRLKRYINN